MGLMTDPRVYQRHLALHCWAKHKITLVVFTWRNDPVKGQDALCRILRSECHIVITKQYWNYCTTELGSLLGYPQTCIEAMPQVLRFERFGIVASFVKVFFFLLT